MHSIVRGSGNSRDDLIDMSSRNHHHPGGFSTFSNALVSLNSASGILSSDEFSAYRFLQDPYDHDFWSSLIPRLAAFSPIDDNIRQIYEAALRLFPLSVLTWKSYIEHEMQQEHWLEAKALLDRVLPHLYHIDIYTLYVDYVRKVQRGSEDEKYHIQKAYEFALDSVGYDVRSEGLWRGYIEHLKSISVSTKDEADLKRQALCIAYEKALSMPIHQSSSFVKDYETYLDVELRTEKQARLTKINQTINQLRSVALVRFNYLKFEKNTTNNNSHHKKVFDCNFPTPFPVTAAKRNNNNTAVNNNNNNITHRFGGNSSTSTSSSSTFIDPWTVWKPIVDYERTNPHRAHFHVLRSRVVYTFKKAMPYCLHSLQYWYEYTNFLKLELTKPPTDLNQAHFTQNAAFYATETFYGNGHVNFSAEDQQSSDTATTGTGATAGQSKMIYLALPALIKAQQQALQAQLVNVWELSLKFMGYSPILRLMYIEFAQIAQLPADPAVTAHMVKVATTQHMTLLKNLENFPIIPSNVTLQSLSLWYQNTFSNLTTRAAQLLWALYMECEQDGSLGTTMPFTLPYSYRQFFMHHYSFKSFQQFLSGPAQGDTSGGDDGAVAAGYGGIDSDGPMKLLLLLQNKTPLVDICEIVGSLPHLTSMQFIFNQQNIPLTIAPIGSDYTKDLTELKDNNNQQQQQQSDNTTTTTTTNNSNNNVQHVNLNINKQIKVKPLATPSFITRTINPALTNASAILNTTNTTTTTTASSSSSDSQNNNNMSDNIDSNNNNNKQQQQTDTVEQQQQKQQQYDYINQYNTTIQNICNILHINPTLFTTIINILPYRTQLQQLDEYPVLLLLEHRRRIMGQNAAAGLFNELRKHSAIICNWRCYLYTAQYLVSPDKASRLYPKAKEELLRRELLRITQDMRILYPLSSSQQRNNNTENGNSSMMDNNKNGDNNNNNTDDIIKNDTNNTITKKDYSTILLTPKIQQYQQKRLFYFDARFTQRHVDFLERKATVIDYQDALSLVDQILNNNFINDNEFESLYIFFYSKQIQLGLKSGRYTGSNISNVYYLQRKRQNHLGHNEQLTVLEPLDLYMGTQALQQQGAQAALLHQQGQQNTIQQQRTATTMQSLLQVGTSSSSNATTSTTTNNIGNNNKQSNGNDSDDQTSLIDRFQPLPVESALEVVHAIFPDFLNISLDSITLQTFKNLTDILPIDNTSSLSTGSTLLNRFTGNNNTNNQGNNNTSNYNNNLTSPYQHNNNMNNNDGSDDYDNNNNDMSGNNNNNGSSVNQGIMSSNELELLSNLQQTISITTTTGGGGGGGNNSGTTGGGWKGGNNNNNTQPITSTEILYSAPVLRSCDGNKQRHFQRHAYTLPNLSKFVPFNINEHVSLQFPVPYHITDMPGVLGSGGDVNDNDKNNEENNPDDNVDDGQNINTKSLILKCQPIIENNNKTTTPEDIKIDQHSTISLGYQLVPIDMDEETSCTTIFTTPPTTNTNTTTTTSSLSSLPILDGTTNNNNTNIKSKTNNKFILTPNYYYKLSNLGLIHVPRFSILYNYFPGAALSNGLMYLYKTTMATMYSISDLLPKIPHIQTHLLSHLTAEHGGNFLTSQHIIQQKEKALTPEDQQLLQDVRSFNQRIAGMYTIQLDAMNRQATIDLIFSTGRASRRGINLMNNAINNAGNNAATAAATGAAGTTGTGPTTTTDIVIDLTRQEVADIILQSLLSTTQRTFREPTIPEDYAIQLQTNNLHLQRIAQTLSNTGSGGAGMPNAAAMVQQQQQRINNPTPAVAGAAPPTLAPGMRPPQPPPPSNIAAPPPQVRPPPMGVLPGGMPPPPPQQQPGQQPQGIAPPPGTQPPPQMARPPQPQQGMTIPMGMQPPPHGMMMVGPQGMMMMAPPPPHQQQQGMMQQPPPPQGIAPPPQGIAPPPQQQQQPGAQPMYRYQ